jgi:hypothetical protein
MSISPHHVNELFDHERDEINPDYIRKTAISFL